MNFDRRGGTAPCLPGRAVSDLDMLPLMNFKRGVLNSEGGWWLRMFQIRYTRSHSSYIRRKADSGSCAISPRTETIDELIFTDILTWTPRLRQI